GGDGTNSLLQGAAFSPATSLWSNPTKLASYDMLMLSCEGSTSKFIDQKPQTSVDNVATYVGTGGRVFLSHLHYSWLTRSAAFNTTATYPGVLTQPPSPIDVTVNQTFPKGAALAQWLATPGVAA